MKRFNVEAFPGNKVKELNPIPKPRKGYYDNNDPADEHAYKAAIEEYKDAESQRREFQIQGEDLEKLAEESAGGLTNERTKNRSGGINICLERSEHIAGFKEGYAAAKQKYPYSEEDIRKCFEAGEIHEYEKHFGAVPPMTENFDQYIKSLSPQIGSIVEVEEVGNGVVKIVKG